MRERIIQIPDVEHVDVLDHGYIKFIDRWGSDEAVIEAARQSTGKGFLGWDPRDCDCVTIPGVPVPPDQSCLYCEGTGKLRGDMKLLRYLEENKHSTPFEFAGMVIEVQAPIFVFREWQRHRTQGYSEMSARYTPLPDFSYMPTIERLMINAGSSNKQAGTVKGAPVLTVRAAMEFQEALARTYHSAQMDYEDALGAGIPKELARVGLPVGRYSRMRATTCLRNWLGFLTLRRDPKAQWEIRQYANIVGTMIQELHPRTWELYVENKQ